MSDNTYNGWKNWETWSMNLHITNDAGVNGFWYETAKNYLQEHIDSDECEHEAWSEEWVRDVSYKLSETMKDVIEESLDDSQGDWEDNFNSLLIKQLINGCLSEVNWDEIAAHFIDSASYDFKQKSTQLDET